MGKDGKHDVIRIIWYLFTVEIPAMNSDSEL